MAIGKKPTLFVREATGLVREFGVFSAFIWTFADIVSTGINYFIVQIPFYYPGADVLLSTIAAGIPALIGGICIMMLITAIPRVAGQYVMFSRGGEPVTGNIIGGFVFWIFQIYQVAWFAYIPTFFWGHLAYIMGKIGGVTSLMELGMAISTTFLYRFGLGLVLMVIFLIVDMLGSRVLKWAINITWLIYMIGGIGALVMTMAVPPEAVPKAWDAAWGAGAYDEIMNVAKANGWGVTPFSGSATFSSLAFTFWAYTGFEYIAPIAGELREPRKTAFVGSVISTIVIILWYSLIAGFLYRGFGDFISAYDYVVLGGYGDQLKINPGLEPILPLFCASLTTDPTLQLAIAGFVPFSMVNAVPGAQATGSRTLFGMAFDRQLPEVLTKVGRVFKGPIVAAMVTAIAGIFWLYFYVQDIFVAVCDLDFFCSLFYIWFGIAAIGISLRRKDLWERGYKLTIGGIPVMLIMGILTVAVTGWLQVLIAVQGLDMYSIITFMVVMLIGGVIFAHYWLKNEKKGIDVETLYHSLPPE